MRHSHVLIHENVTVSLLIGQIERMPAMLVPVIFRMYYSGP
jgi:hypothetical protein